MQAQRRLLENLFSPFGEIDGEDRCLPSLFAAVDFNVQRAPDNLMAEAYPDYANSVLCQDLLGEVDELDDPGYVIEGVTFSKP